MSKHSEESSLRGVCGQRMKHNTEKILRPTCRGLWVHELNLHSLTCEAGSPWWSSWIIMAKMALLWKSVHFLHGCQELNIWHEILSPSRISRWKCSVDNVVRVRSLIDKAEGQIWKLSTQKGNTKITERIWAPGAPFICQVEQAHRAVASSRRLSFYILENIGGRDTWTLECPQNWGIFSAQRSIFGVSPGCFIARIRELMSSFALFSSMKVTNNGVIRWTKDDNMCYL